MSKRKKTEDALNIERQQLLSIFDSIDGPVYVSDPDSYEVLYANQALVEVFGDVIGQKCYRAVQGMESPCSFCTNEHIFGENEGKAYIWELQNKINERWYHCIDRAIRWPDGRLVRYEMAIDITERKEAEDKLRASEHKYLELYNSAPDGIITVDESGYIRSVNPAIKKLMGYKEEELIGKHFTKAKLLSSKSVKNALKKFASIMEGKGLTPTEFDIVRKDKSLVTVEMKSSLLKREGKITEVQLVFRDVTERKRAEGQVLRQSAVLDAINKVFRETLRCETDEEVARTCLAVAGELTGSRFGFIGEVNESGRFDTIALSDPGWKACRMPKSDVVRMIKDMEIRGIWGRVLKDGRSLIVNDPASHPDRVGIPEGHPPLTSFLGVPLKREGKTIGMIALANKGGGYSLADQEDVEALSVAFLEALIRKRAEEALRESEEKYRDLYDNAPDMYHSLDKNGIIIDCNESEARTLGYKKEEIIGRPVTDFFTEESKRLFKRDFPKLNKNKVQLNLEREFVRKDGSIFPASLNVFSVYKDGKLIGTKTISRDITERKRAEEALREKERFLSNIFVSIQDGISILDKDMNIIRVNPAMEQWYSHSMPLAGKKCYQAYHERSKRCKACPSHRTLETGEAAYEVVPKRGPGGEIVGWLDLYSFPLVDTATGQVKGAIEYVRDITERKQAEESLRRSVEELEAVREIDRSIIEKPDLSSLLRFIVRKARELTSTDAAFYSFVEGGVIRHHTFLGIHTKAFKDIRLRKGTGLGWLVLEENKPVAVEDFFSDERLKDAPYGAVREEGLVSFLAVPFMSGRGEPLGVLYVANHKKTKFAEEQVRTLVTLAVQTSVAVEHARLYEKLKKAYEELKSLDELKDNLITNVTHELRTPLTIAGGAIELAEEEDSRDKRKELLKMAADALVRQNSIVSDLIEAAYVKKGKLKLKLEEVNLAHIIALVSDEFKPMVIKDKIKMNVRVQKDLPRVRANQKQLEHILRNLLSNAIKFNKKGGKISIEARKKGKFVEVSVADTGIGIAEEKLPKVFDKFYQVDSSIGRLYGGMGLGLAIVKEIVQVHGGEIDVESKHRKGSRFYFTLPLAKRG